MSFFVLLIVESSQRFVSNSNNYINYREVLPLSEPRPRAYGGLCCAGRGLVAHLEHAAPALGVAAQERVGHGALAHPGLPHDHHAGVRVGDGVVLC